MTGASGSRTMIVTGGSRGIGAATARLAARDGWDVCINYLSAEDAARSVAAEVERAGRRAIVVQGDMGREADIVRLFDTTVRELGVPGAVVLNAGGVVGRRRRVDEMSWDAVSATVTLNLTGVIIGCREAIRRMSTRHGGAGGAIVNVSSASARLGAPNLWMDYAASKGGVDTLTAGLALEVAEEGIRVNGVRPGLIDTELHASAGMPDRVERAGRHLPMKRAGTAEEVAEAIVWLASPAASYVSGSIVDVAGAR
jgi:NAD(P)-dependent dehydrogenase (short-subunit alcohol dehydrogenase family)